MTDHAKRVYYAARNDWLEARAEYKKRLDQMALQQLEGRNEDTDWDVKLSGYFDVYQKVVSKYLAALKSYALVRPEMRGRLAYDLGQQAGFAQLAGKDHVADQHMQSLRGMAVENAKIAHEDWTKHQDKEHFAAVILALSDAQLMNAQDDADVAAISKEMFDLFEKGKVGRDRNPAPALNNAPTIPAEKKPRRRKRPLELRQRWDWWGE